MVLIKYKIFNKTVMLTSEEISFYETMITTMKMYGWRLSEFDDYRDYYKNDKCIMLTFLLNEKTKFKRMHIKLLLSSDLKLDKINVDSNQLTILHKTYMNSIREVYEFLVRMIN